MTKSKGELKKRESKKAALKAQLQIGVEYCRKHQVGPWAALRALPDLRLITIGKLREALSHSAPAPDARMILRPEEETQVAMFLKGCDEHGRDGALDRMQIKAKVVALLKQSFE